MSKVDNAVSCFREGFSCAQALFSTYCTSLGLNSKKALKISTAFGGGMGHIGEACGAVTGALMAIGLKYGRTGVEDIEAKKKTYSLCGEFARKFKSIHGTLNCTDLLGCDLSTAQGLETAKERDLFNTRCVDFVKDAAEILEQII